MQLTQVDVLDAEPAQARVASPHQVAPRGTHIELALPVRKNT